MQNLENKNNNNRGILYEVLINHFLQNSEYDIITIPKRPTAKDDQRERLRSLLQSFPEPEIYRLKHLAYNAAQEVKHKFSNRKITDVWWTSNKNDVSQLLGKETHNASDLVISLDEKDFIGISIKLSHSNKPSNKANLGSDSIKAIYGINIDSILNDHRSIVRNYANGLGIKLVGKDINELVRNTPSLKILDKHEHTAFYMSLKNMLMNKFNQTDQNGKAELIKQSIGHYNVPAFPVYELKTITTKKFTEHKFVDSIAESDYVLTRHLPYLTVYSKNKSRNITIKGENNIPLLNIDVNSRSTSILSGLQCRFFAWNRKAFE